MENNCIYCLFDALVLDLIASNYTDARTCRYPTASEDIQSQILL